MNSSFKNYKNENAKIFAATKFYNAGRQVLKERSYKIPDFSKFFHV